MNTNDIIEMMEKELEFNKSWYNHYSRVEPLTSISMLYLGRVTAIEETLKAIYNSKMNMGVWE